MQGEVGEDDDEIVFYIDEDVPVQDKGQMPIPKFVDDYDLNKVKNDTFSNNLPFMGNVS